MSIKNSILKCFAGKFKRLKYFHGMLLTETDFQEEQTYFREKIKLHNRIHGYGVVWGLCLKAKESDPGTSKIIIEAGLALDCRGNEIIVCNNQEVELTQYIKKLEDRGKIHSLDQCTSPPGVPPKLYIGIKYCECDAEPVQQYTSECSTDDLQPQFSRVKEGFSVKIFAQDELPPAPDLNEMDAEDYCMKPSQYCPGAKPCYVDEHFIILGSVEIDEENIYQILDDSIDVSDKRKIVFAPALWHNWQWQLAKQAVIPLICQQAEWKDISIIIGKKVERAVCILIAMGMIIEDNDDYIKPISSIDKYVTIMDMIKNTLPFAPAGIEIKLITDGKYVLFPYVETYPDDPA